MRDESTYEIREEKKNKKKIIIKSRVVENWENFSF